MENASDNTRRAFLGGVLLGAGLGGFFDGILFHQILQWHHLISEVEPATTVGGLQVNTLADGLFHAATYALTVGGLVLLWQGLRGAGGAWTTPALISTVLIGWGLFNLLEGLVNHQVLGLHHLQPGPYELAWDLAYLAWGAAMLVGGLLLWRRSMPQPTRL